MPDLTPSDRDRALRAFFSKLIVDVVVVSPQRRSLLARSTIYTLIKAIGEIIFPKEELSSDRCLLISH
jgi:hypothetical protein